MPIRPQHVRRDALNLNAHYPTDECTTACRNRKIVAHTYPVQLYVGTDQESGTRTAVVRFMRGRTVRLQVLQFIADMLPAAVALAASASMTNLFGERPDYVETDQVGYWLAGVIFAALLSNVLRGVVRTSEREPANAPEAEDVQSITDFRILADTREALVREAPEQSAPTHKPID